MAPILLAKTRACVQTSICHSARFSLAEQSVRNVYSHRLGHQLLQTPDLDLHVGHLLLEVGVAVKEPLQLLVHRVLLRLLPLPVLEGGRPVLRHFAGLFLQRVRAGRRLSAHFTLVLLPRLGHRSAEIGGTPLGVGVGLGRRQGRVVAGGRGGQREGGSGRRDGGDDVVVSGGGGGRRR